jgi:TonB family protein
LDYFTFTSTRALLTETERKILITTHDLDSRALPEAYPVTALPPSTDRGGPTFTATGYPRGFMSSVFATTNCKLSKSSNARVEPGAATVVLRRDGGLSRVGLIATGIPESCDTAVRTLLLTYIAPVDRAFRDGDTALLMIPVTADYVQCHEANGSVPGAQTPARPFADSRMIPVPKKTRDMEPQYPLSMRSRGISGVVILESVISTTGCVQHARVLRSAHPALDWAAMRAVLDWRYTPTKIDGVPTPMGLSVTVNFVLN